MTSALVDVTYGDVSQEEGDRLALAAWDGLKFAHQPGSTEPWISRLVADFVLASGARNVLETGGYLGDTSVLLLDALMRLGSGRLTVCEIDLERCHHISNRLVLTPEQRASRLSSEIVVGDVLDFLRRTRDTFDLCWLDDSHDEAHVREEMALLYPRMRSGGLILLHDVVGMCPGNTEELGRTVEKWGGYVLKLPRLGPAGGLGIVQVR